MQEQSDSLFTVVSDVDLMDNKFRAVHFVGNDHVDIQIPRNTHQFRTLHLGATQLMQWAQRLHRFYGDILAANPEHPTDFQI